MSNLRPNLGFALGFALYCLAVVSGHLIPTSSCLLGPRPLVITVSDGQCPAHHMQTAQGSLSPSLTSSSSELDPVQSFLWDLDTLYSQLPRCQGNDRVTIMAFSRMCPTARSKAWDS